MTTGKDLLTSVANVQGKSDISTMKNKGIISGSVVGMVGGFYYAYAKKHNMLVCGLLGAVAGAIVAGILIPSS